MGFFCLSGSSGTNTKNHTLKHVHTHVRTHTHALGIQPTWDYIIPLAGLA